MNLRNFIGASSAILLAWLGATYMHQVPSERYPSQTRKAAPAVSAIEKENNASVAINETVSQ